MFIISYKGRETESITKKEIKIPHNHSTQKEAQLLWGLKPPDRETDFFFLNTYQVKCHLVTGSFAHQHHVNFFKH